MFANGREVILSTGEFDFIKQDFEYNERAKYGYPRKLVLKVPGVLEVKLTAKRILEAENMLDNFGLFIFMQRTYFGLDLDISGCCQISRYK